MDESAFLFQEGKENSFVGKTEEEITASSTDTTVGMINPEYAYGHLLQAEIIPINHCNSKPAYHLILKYNWYNFQNLLFYCAFSFHDDALTIIRY